MTAAIHTKASIANSIRMILITSLLIGLFINLIPVHSRAVAQTSDRGYLTSIEDLEYISRQARWGIEPYATNVEQFFDRIESPDEWDHGEAGEEYVLEDGNDGDCVPADPSADNRFIHQQGGAQGVYQKMIAYHLIHDIEFAKVARGKLLELTETFGFGGNIYGGENECILLLAFAVPLWIQAADLLELEPIWTEHDKELFQNWLKDQVYPKVAWASRVRRNNWGSAGSLAASMIGDYLIDRDVVLIEIEPEPLELTPQQAFDEHNEMQLMRMNTQWKGDSRCDIWGIQSYGGIPDELRRGDTGCEQQWLEEGEGDQSYSYQLTQIQHLVFHAEYLRRRGNTMLYDNINADGSGSLLNAFLFVIDNPVNPEKSYEWDGYYTGVLSVAYQYYENESLREAIYVGPLQRGGMIAYAQLTHPLAEIHSWEHQ